MLVGMTYDEPAGERLEQVFGTMMLADRDQGITLRLEGKRAGELFRLPPDLSAFEPASPGRYALRTTGEVVCDPNYTACWTVTSP